MRNSAQDKVTANELFRAGKLNFEQQDFPSAVQIFKKAAQTNPADPEIHVFLGKAHMELDEYLQAIEAFKRALEIEPTIENTCALSKAYISAKDCLAACELVIAALAEFGESADLHYQLGVAYRHGGSDGLALQHYLLAIEADQNHRDSLLNTAYHYSRSCEWQMALKYSERALATDPHDVELLANVLYASHCSSDYERKKRALAELFVACPDHPYIINQANLWLDYIEAHKTYKC